MSPVLSRGTARTWTVALRALLLAVAATIAYTAAVSLVGLLLPSQAHGSLVRSGEDVVGSALIGQGFVDEDGDALPEWFQSRPSAAGDGWDGGASGASNLGPNNPDLLRAIRERAAGGGAAPDALTASGSGLDPHISPENARAQVDRVATARGLDPARVRALVEQQVQAPDLGYLGRPTVNVLRLNLALAAAA